MKNVAVKKTMTSLSNEDIQDIKNLFANSRQAHIQDTEVLKELIETEEDLINKIGSIQNERDSLGIENLELKKEIKKLERYVSKANGKPNSKS